jgi:hypothetical protein
MPVISLFQLFLIFLIQHYWLKYFSLVFIVLSVLDWKNFFGLSSQKYQFRPQILKVDEFF